MKVRVFDPTGRLVWVPGHWVGHPILGRDFTLPTQGQGAEADKTDKNNEGESNAEDDC